MIVAGPEGFRKNQYRKFNIRSADLAPGDDFGMMREVLTRRFKRLISEAPRDGESKRLQSASLQSRKSASSATFAGLAPRQDGAPIDIDGTARRRGATNRPGRISC